MATKHYKTSRTSSNAVAVAVADTPYTTLEVAVRQQPGLQGRHPHVAKHYRNRGLVRVSSESQPTSSRNFKVNASKADIHMLPNTTEIGAR